MRPHWRIDPHGSGDRTAGLEESGNSGIEIEVVRLQEEEGLRFEGAVGYLAESVDDSNMRVAVQGLRLVLHGNRAELTQSSILDSQLATPAHREIGVKGTSVNCNLENDLHLAKDKITLKSSDFFKKVKVEIKYYY